MDAIQTHGPIVLLVKAVSLPFCHLIRTNFTNYNSLLRYIFLVKLLYISNYAKLMHIISSTKISIVILSKLYRPNTVFHTFLESTKDRAQPS